jgi:hypothetical protein
MRYATLLIPLVLIGCKQADPAPKGASSTPTAVTQAAAAPAPQTVQADLQGRWDRVGTYCGSAYTTFGSTEILDFQPTQIVTSLNTVCSGITPTQYWDVVYGIGGIQQRLNSAYDGTCPTHYAASPSSPWNSYGVHVIQTGTPWVLELTEGTCIDGTVQKLVYHKE